MGIKGLYSYLKHYRTQATWATVGTQGPLRVGMDAMSVLYRYRGDTDHILSIIRGMKRAGHRVFFVFDGKPPPEKEREVASRREAKATAATTATGIEAFLASEGAAALSARDREHLEISLARAKTESWHITRESRRAFQERLWQEEIPYVKSVSEADDVLTDLVAAGKLDVILTTDMDYLMACCGNALTLWIPSRRGGEEMEEIRLDEVLEGEGLTPAAFLDACLLCGTDEREGLRGVPAHTAFAWMRHYGSLEALMASNVADRAFRSMFGSEEAIRVAREGRYSGTDPYGRVRPDHLERVQDFLNSL